MPTGKSRAMTAARMTGTAARRAVGPAPPAARPPAEISAATVRPPPDRVFPVALLGAVVPRVGDKAMTGARMTGAAARRAGDRCPSAALPATGIGAATVQPTADRDLAAALPTRGPEPAQVASPGQMIDVALRGAVLRGVVRVAKETGAPTPGVVSRTVVEIGAEALRIEGRAMIAVRMIGGALHRAGCQAPPAARPPAGISAAMVHPAADRNSPLALPIGGLAPVPAASPGRTTGAVLRGAVLRGVARVAAATGAPPREAASPTVAEIGAAPLRG
jgi:hypothetical protein